MLPELGNDRSVRAAEECHLLLRRPNSSSRGVLALTVYIYLCDVGVYIYMITSVYIPVCIYIYENTYPYYVHI